MLSYLIFQGNGIGGFYPFVGFVTEDSAQLRVKVFEIPFTKYFINNINNNSVYLA